jgi:hypothetical protein
MQVPFGGAHVGMLFEFAGYVRELATKRGGEFKSLVSVLRRKCVNIKASRSGAEDNYVGMLDLN